MTSFAWSLESLIGGPGRFGMIASGVDEGIFAVDTKEPSLLLITKIATSCDLWKADLGDEAMLKHAEDDVGISDPGGAASFAPYFATALTKLIHVENSSGSFPSDVESASITLRLDYQIGTMQIDGFLKLTLIQKTTNPEFYTMMKLLYTSDPGRKVFASSQRSVLGSAYIPIASGASYSSSYTSQEIAATTTSSAKGDDGDESVEPDEVVVKAKKRKATGVNLFSNKKYTH